TTAPDVLLQRMPPVSVSGHVFSSVGHTPLPQAQVDLFKSDGVTKIATAFTDGSGFYGFAAVPVGASYLVRASRSGFSPAQQLITVNPGQPLTNVDFVLQP